MSYRKGDNNPSDAAARCNITVGLFSCHKAEHTLPVSNMSAKCPKYFISLQCSSPVAIPAIHFYVNETHVLRSISSMEIA